MDSRSKTIFLFLILLQGVHSIEEYAGSLWEAFSPADYTTRLLAENQEISFLLINLGFFLFGMWCWYLPIRKEFPMAPVLTWFWILIEVINGIGHSIWGLYEKDYVPGLLTAPFLLLTALYLAGKILLAQTPDR